jgi:RimJ/RimL family protein N-acetyltransferase
MSKLTPEKFKIKDGKEVLIKSPVPDEWTKTRDFINCIKMESQSTYQYPGQPELLEEETRKRIQAAIDSPKRMMVNVEFEGRFIAQMDFLPAHRNEEHPWLKHNTHFGMSVVKEFWQQGIAKRLLEILERETKKAGYKWIRAEVRESNLRGVKLYTSFGFEITGRQKNYAFIDGNYHDDLTICKEIS